MAGQKQNMAPMWQTLMKNGDLDERTSFLEHVYMGCTYGPLLVLSPNGPEPVTNAQYV